MFDFFWYLTVASPTYIDVWGWGRCISSQPRAVMTPELYFPPSWKSTQTMKHITRIVSTVIFLAWSDTKLILPQPASKTYVDDSHNEAQKTHARLLLLPCFGYWKQFYLLLAVHVSLKPEEVILRCFLKRWGIASRAVTLAGLLVSARSGTVWVDANPVQLDPTRVP